MNSVLNKFRKRNIQTNLYHFVLVIFVVAVSVCLITGLIINYLTLSRSVNRFFKLSNMPNLWIETNQISAEDENFLSSKFDYSKRYSFESEFITGSSEYVGSFLISDGKTSTPYITQGEKEKGCYVDKKFAEKYHFGINHSKIAFNYELNGEIKKIEFKIVGFISLAEDLIADDNCVIFIEENFFLETLKIYFENIENADLSIIEYNQILITSEISETDIKGIQNYYVTSSTSLEKIQKTEELESVVAIQKEIEIAKNMLWIFPIVFVVISILVIVSAISQLVLKERYNIGLLKSIGISNKQILSNYCGYGSFICFLGAVLGLLGSPLIIPNMTFETYDKLFNLPRDEMTLTCPLLVVILVIFCAVLIGYFSALFVCINLTKKTPKECMNKQLKLNLNSRKKKKNFPTFLGATFRNMKINLTRTIMSIVGIAGSSLLCLIGFGVGDILKKNSEDKELFSLGVFSSIFKAFSIVLMILTIIILIIQIFKEREKEMAVLRIHGESYLKIWLSVLLEMLYIGLIGFIFSIVLSGPTMLLNLRIFGINGCFVINFLSYLKTFLIVFLLIFVCAGLGLVKIFKLKLGEAIKFSE